MEMNRNVLQDEVGRGTRGTRKRKGESKRKEKKDYAS